MHPSLSVIFFTTLSGAGYGLLAWSGLTIAMLALRGGLSPALEGVQLAGLGLGLLLSTIGLLCSLAHLGKPGRAWRAFSQWRSSWLSREGVLAVATAPPAAAAMALLLWMQPGATRAAWLACLGLLLAALALATVACTAMIYASLKPIPAWRHPLVLPVYLLFALLTGLALQLVSMAAMLHGQGPAGMLPTLALFGLVLAVLKWLYWRAIDGEPAPATRGAAVGLPAREVRVFERPHTEANYITRDMVFELARRHATRLRRAALAGLVAVPLLATLLMALGWIPALAATLLAALGLLAGAFAERWLFFAQARHVVSAYY
ncbi:DmsC/YnfH family molybdoenzyme membrane anchor subunit [Luteimonas sp. MJ246]|uniref:dimethyl sulfoxide reductase anchor subunit family protein n=1 Tax=Luteimonas sp. MJ174 TaxID=3129237 RepID=UPI0031BA2081